jgi:hypothetical protein
MAAVPVQRGGMAAGTVNTARQLGYAFGVALLGSVFAARAQNTIASHGQAGAATLAHAVAGGQAPVVLAKTAPGARAALDELVHAAAISGLRGTFVVAGVVGVAAGLAVLALVRPAAPAGSAPGTSATGSASGAEEPASATAGSPPAAAASMSTEAPLAG